MAWTPVLLTLLAHCTGSLCQPVLTQPPSVSASLGAAARLPCTVKSDVSVAGQTLLWFQQKPGSRPRFLLSYSSSTSLGSGVPGRFSGSTDASANAGLLLIAGLQPEDEADYHCATSHGGASHGDPRGRGRGTQTSAASSRTTRPAGDSSHLRTPLAQARLVLGPLPLPQGGF
ncbi:unnamed protein product [Pipistrellus nathusii]|uniref:Ig-like domain-containing protein n=1 Tax=Pipistrellus nathusii TaxID=59473 RepID=A0ABN9ZSR4_PIPNA